MIEEAGEGMVEVMEEFHLWSSLHRMGREGSILELNYPQGALLNLTEQVKQQIDHFV